MPVFTGFISVNPCWYWFSALPAVLFVFNGPCFGIAGQTNNMNYRNKPIPLSSPQLIHGYLALLATGAFLLRLLIQN